jgi:hypothetical protein
MPTNSENQTEIVAKKDKKMRNRRYKAKKAAEKALAEAEAKKLMDKSAESFQNEENEKRAAREAAKALAEVETKKIIDESAESLEKAAAKALTETIKALVKREESLINDIQASTSRVQATTPSCPLGIEENGEHHFQTLGWTNFTPTIWTCNHSDDFNGDVFSPIDVAKISTETQSCQAMPIIDTPIACGDWNERDMRKMVADLVQDDEEEVFVDLGDLNLGDQFRKMLEGDDFNQDDYVFYEEVSEESDANGETSKDEEVSEGSDGSFYVVKYPDTQVPKQACG